MKKNIRSVVIGVLTVFLATNLLYANDPAETKGEPDLERKETHIQRIAEKLGLTPEQQQKLKDNQETQRERMSQIVNQMKEKQQALRQELQKPSVTKASLAPILTEINSLQAQLMEGRIDGILAVKEIFTPEQFFKFQLMTEMKQQGMRERFQRLRKNIGRKMRRSHKED